MYSRRTALTVFLAIHLCALALSATPDPARLERVEGVRESSDDAVSALVRPLLDAAASALRAVDRFVWVTTGPVRGYAQRYADRLGVAQSWVMFANPPRGEEYLRFRYYTVDAADRLTMATELVFPKAPTNEWHWVRGYWEGHQDKAISNAVVAYFAARKTTVDGPVIGEDPEQNPAIQRSFKPVVDYFSDRFAAHLAGRRLIRTEAWYGYAPSRPRGEAQVAPVSRAAAVARYYVGLYEEAITSSEFKPVDASEHEADITWLLMYVRRP